MPSVLQPWVHEITLMQQSVLIAATRGPDGVIKDHPAKVLLRWLRRCYLLSAFDKRVLTNPSELGGGSFTGPSIKVLALDVQEVLGPFEWTTMMDKALYAYMRSLDEVPHHYQLHFMHAAEILGYKHPEPWIREWWNSAYLSLVNDMHLAPESASRMDSRLGDKEDTWREAEEVPAKPPEAFKPVTPLPGHYRDHE